MLTDLGLPFLYWLIGKTWIFYNYLHRWLDTLEAPCGEADV